MISIITAIYNQRAVNELFFESLKRHTFHPFELIIIDNGSTDGSGDFFESVGAHVIRNTANYAYPHSQNQGIGAARHDWLAFLNNDIIVSPHWDKVFIDSMQFNQLEVATSCGIEQVENRHATKVLRRRWQLIKNLVGLFGFNKTTLQFMHRWMYPDWVQFSATRRIRFKHAIKEGFVGNTVMIRRQALEKIGIWDERIQAADFDLYLRSKMRAIQYGDMRPVHICLDVFIHHYIRLTSKTKYPPFADADQLIRIDDKWQAQDVAWLEKLNP